MSIVLDYDIVKARLLSVYMCYFYQFKYNRFEYDQLVFCLYKKYFMSKGRS